MKNINFLIFLFFNQIILGMESTQLILKKDNKSEHQLTQQQERKLQHQANHYFLYEKGTSQGVLIEQKFLEKHSGFVKNMVENTEMKPNEIELPFPINTIKDVFGLNVYIDPDWQQVKNFINCSAYLLLNYSKDNPEYHKYYEFRRGFMGNYLLDGEKNWPSPKYMKRLSEWFNRIGKHYVENTVEWSDPKEYPMYYLEFWHSDFYSPDYPVLKLLDPALQRVIIKYCLENEYNFFESYKNYHKVILGDEKSIDDLFDLENDSIVDLLDIVKKEFESSKEKRLEKEEAKKWFWQRKRGFLKILCCSLLVYNLSLLYITFCK